MSEIKKLIAEKEFELAQLKTVYAQFPDVKQNRNLQFHSSAVNKIYSNFDIVDEYNKIVVMPYIEVPFDFDGQTHSIKVYANPIKNTLIYFAYIRDEYNTYKSVIQCSQMAANLKSKKFSDKMVGECASAMIEFIQKHPKYELSKKNLPERLEKLLNFA